MAIDIETATLEDYRNMMLRPTKLNEIAQVLYDLAQKSSGSLIEIESNKIELELLQDRIESAENDISDLKERVSVLTDDITRLETSIDDLDERVTTLENE